MHLVEKYNIRMKFESERPATRHSVVQLAYNRNGETISQTAVTGRRVETCRAFFIHQVIQMGSIILWRFLNLKL